MATGARARGNNSSRTVTVPQRQQRRRRPEGFHCDVKLAAVGFLFYFILLLSVFTYLLQIQKEEEKDPPPNHWVSVELGETPRCHGDLEPTAIELQKWGLRFSVLGTFRK